MRPALSPKAFRLARLLLPATTLLALLSPGAAVTPVRPESAPTGQTPSVGTPNDAVVGLPPEVRLRKLHLVRPDLIPYPISYDVYC